MRLTFGYSFSVIHAVVTYGDAPDVSRYVMSTDSMLFCCVARYETTLNCLGIKQVSFYRGGCHGRSVSSFAHLVVPMYGL